MITEHVQVFVSNAEVSGQQHLYGRQWSAQMFVSVLFFSLQVSEVRGHLDAKRTSFVVCVVWVAPTPCSCGEVFPVVFRA